MDLSERETNRLQHVAESYAKELLCMEDPVPQEQGSNYDAK